MVSEAQYVLSIDQGTSATKALLLDSNAVICGRGESALTETHLKNGFVEQNPLEIEESVRRAIELALGEHSISEIVAVGISNQRESVVLWDKQTGKPISQLISWQDSRAAELCDEIRANGKAKRVETLSGLPLDPMFSAAKIRWLLDHFDPTREKSLSGQYAVGTVDSWLTRSASNHSIEIGNASRTQLLDINSGKWSPELLQIFNIPIEVLPVIRNSDFPTSISSIPELSELPVRAILGDSHSALFGHGIQSPGIAKVTYGTGSSVMALAKEINENNNGICRTIAWAFNNEISYALEGNIRSAGATLKWVSQITGRSTAELIELSNGAKSSPLQIVPSFNGLGAPWWNADARGAVTGLTLAAGPAEFAQAAINAMALQVRDVIIAMNKVGANISILDVDGGASANDNLMRLQSDLLHMVVRRPASSDYSALGTAYLAGISAKIWGSEIFKESNFESFAPAPISEFDSSLIRNWDMSLDLVKNYSGK